MPYTLMNTPSNPETPKSKPLSAWDRPWTRLQIGYYLAIFVVLSILLGVAHPIQSLPFNLLIAALWPATTILAGIGGVLNGQFSAVLIPIICYGSYFLVADIRATWIARKDRQSGH